MDGQVYSYQKHKTKKEMKMENQNLQGKQQNSWNQSEVENITKTLAVIINGQKAFGKDYSLKDVLAYYNLKLNGRYSADQVISAIMAYTDMKNDVPAPADLITIIKPPEPKITYAEYKYALEQHAAEGYPMFGYFGIIIKDYEGQQRKENDVPSYKEILEKRAGHVTIQQQMKAIGDK
jgi:hypothetical protein